MHCFLYPKAFFSTKYNLHGFNLVLIPLLYSSPNKLYKALFHKRLSTLQDNSFILFTLRWFDITRNSVLYEPLISPFSNTYALLCKTCHCIHSTVCPLTTLLYKTIFSISSLYSFTLISTFSSHLQGFNLTRFTLHSITLHDPIFSYSHSTFYCPAIHSKTL